MARRCAWIVLLALAVLASLALAPAAEAVHCPDGDRRIEEQDGSWGSDRDNVCAVQDNAAKGPDVVEDALASPDAVLTHATDAPVSMIGAWRSLPTGDALGTVHRSTVAPAVEKGNDGVSGVEDRSYRAADRRPVRTACGEAFGDARLDEDASAQPADAPGIELDGSVLLGHLGVQCQKDGDLVVDDEIDWFAVDVERGVRVSTFYEGKASCRVFPPGVPVRPDGSGWEAIWSWAQETKTCNEPWVAARTGTALLRVTETGGDAGHYLFGGVKTEVEDASTPDPRVSDVGPWHSGHREATRPTGSGQASSRPLSGTSSAHADGGRPVPTVRDPGMPAVAVAAGAAIVIGLVVRLYRRLTKGDALDNDLRSAILDRVRDEPGIPPSELADDLDVALNTVLYHARILEELDFLVLDDSGRPNRLYAEGAQDRRSHDLMDVLRRDGKGDVLRAVRDEPGIHIAELARRLDRHPSTVQRHADALVEAGLLDDDRVDGTRRLGLPPEVAESGAWDRVETAA